MGAQHYGSEDRVNKGNPSVLNRIPERPQLPESTRAPFRCGTDKLFLHLPPQLDDFAVSEIPEPRPPLRVPLCSLPSTCCLFDSRSTAREEREDHQVNLVKDVPHYAFVP